MPNTTPEFLTGAALLARIDEVNAEHPEGIGKLKMLEDCGYTSTKEDGSTRGHFVEFFNNWECAEAAADLVQEGEIAPSKLWWVDATTPQLVRSYMKIECLNNVMIKLISAFNKRYGFGNKEQFRTQMGLPSAAITPQVDGTYLVTYEGCPTAIFNPDGTMVCQESGQVEDFTKVKPILVTAARFLDQAYEGKYQDEISVALDDVINDLYGPEE